MTVTAIQIGLHPDCRFVFNYSATSTPDDIRRWYPNPANETPAV
jgi:hypothetical protein